MVKSLARRGQQVSTMTATAIDRVLMHAYHTHKLSLRDVMVMKRTVLLHAHALATGQASPELPRRVTKSLRMTFYFAAWRFSVQHTVLFVLGSLCMLPALPILLWTLGRWVSRTMSLVLTITGAA